MALLGVATLVAYYLKGLCGFANTLVYTTIMSFGANNISISPLELLTGYPSNLIIALRERKHIHWPTVLFTTVLLLLGSLPGVFLLKTGDSRLIKLALGGVIILVAAQTYWREKHPRQSKGSPVVTTLVGLASGLLCGLYGIGALMAAYLNHISRDTHAFKGNVCMVFFLENTCRIVLYACTGVITAEIVKTALLMTPVMLLGLWLGVRSASFVNERTAKKLVILALALSGAALILAQL